MWFGSLRQKHIARTANWQNRVRKRIRATDQPDHPIGPKLVRGRGLQRRRPNYGAAGWLVFFFSVILAAAMLLLA